MFLQLVSRCRSVRRFDESKRLTRDDLLFMVECARLSPSAANRQPLRYRIVHTEDECAALFPQLRWAGYLKDWDGPAPGERPTGYIVILAPLEPSRSQLLDVGIASQSIMLAAGARGFGACMFASVERAAVQAAFTLPADLEIILVMAFGVPAETVVVEVVLDQDNIEYWRDLEGIHHVPKRKLEDLLLPED